jgi:ATP-dependent DNA helicase RecQ
MSPDRDAVDRTLRDTFGFPALREGQQAVIDRLLAGKSVLAIFPTGAGKSLCYQLPALLLDGVTLVISPLIALMKDQIDFLVKRGIAAARLDSSVDGVEARDTYRKLRDGALKLLYIAPERLANERFLGTLSRMKIALLAVDEAHCISEWGHNFRPDYLKLAALAERLKVGRVLGLTATATPPVAEQIARAFSIAADDVVRTGFYRPNLNLAVSPAAEAEHERCDLLLARIRKRTPGPTIVYVTLQRTAETVAAELARQGLTAEPYHAGLDAEARHAIQDRFMASDHSIVVATIAFGITSTCPRASRITPRRSAGPAATASRRPARCSPAPPTGSRWRISPTATRRPPNRSKAS